MRRELRFESWELGEKDEGSKGSVRTKILRCGVAALRDTFL